MTTLIPLPERLDLARAADLQSAILARIGEPLTLDAQNVRHLGTSALQVLLATTRTWRGNGHALTIAAPSPQFLETLASAGMTIGDLVSSAVETPR